MARFNGVLNIRLSCRSIGKPVEVPLLFSFDGRKREEGFILGKLFSPPGVLGFLVDKEFFLIKNFSPTSSTLLKARVEEVFPDKDEAVIKLLDDSIPDRRFFDRFVFCPEKLGDFFFQTPDGEVEVEISDISVSGVHFLVQKRQVRKVEVGYRGILRSDSKVVSVEVVRVDDGGSYYHVGCKVVSSNFNLLKFIVENYVDEVAELLMKKS
ncbi:MAG: hypothetical protein ABGX12_03735 [Desulfurobacteriaceae bacterium]